MITKRKIKLSCDVLKRKSNFAEYFKKLVLVVLVLTIINPIINLDNYSGSTFVTQGFAIGEVNSVRPHIFGLVSNLLNGLIPVIEQQNDLSNTVSEMTNDYKVLLASIKEDVGKINSLNSSTNQSIINTYVDGAITKTINAEKMAGKSQSKADIKDMYKLTAAIIAELPYNLPNLKPLKNELRILSQMCHEMIYTTTIKSTENLDGSIQAQISMNNVDTNDWAENRQLSQINDKSEISTVILDIQSSNVPKKADIIINPELLKEAAKKNIDQFILKTGIAQFSLNVQNFQNTKEKLDCKMSKPDIQELSTDEQKIYDKSSGDFFQFNISSDSKVIDKFENPVKVSVPYQLKKGENSNNMTVLYVDDNGKTQNMAGFYDVNNGRMTFSTKHFSMFLILRNSINFNDSDDQSWAKDYILSMASKGIISGTGDNKFNPKSPVTRAQFVTMIVNATKILQSTQNSLFQDVSNDEWYRPFVMTAYEQNIVKGFEGNFRPLALISRADMAVVVSNTMKKVYGRDITLDSPSTGGLFKDSASIPEYAQKSVGGLVKQEIMGGRQNGNFDPLELASRAEAAIVIYKLMQTSMK